MVVFTIVFGTSCRPAEREDGALCDHGLCRHAAVVPFLLNPHRGIEQFVGNANLIGKVYFPRLIMPASSAVTALRRFRASTS